MLPAVIVQGLGKRFCRYDANRPRTIMEAALAGWRRMRTIDQFWALRDIDFTVYSGQMLGILGHNGAGKSTLLQLLGGVVTPDAGKIKIVGRIGALLDLGASFHPDLTGRENVFISAVVAGLTHQEVAQRFNAIVEFSELQQFIDTPLRTYSTGMQMRLAFSIAVHTEPDVFLVDEHLSVGDVSFQAKCLNRITQLKSQGCAIVLVSHNAEQIQRLCDQALWLSGGRIAAYGEPGIVAAQYTSKMEATAQSEKLAVHSREAKITAVRLLNQHQMPTLEISNGDSLKVEIEYRSTQAFPDSIFSVSISDEAGHICFNTHTASAKIPVPLAPGLGQINLYLDRLDLSGGSYYVNVGVFKPDWSYAYDYHWHVYPLLIHQTNPDNSILSPPRHWEIATSPISLSSE